ncbi:hypothetical protein BDQ17DRAFT_1257700 [Cyathus striatus]|nr:hypothetical protein BDQ17DRAFT_1257700 [Cyathus striatus]
MVQCGRRGLPHSVIFFNNGQSVMVGYLDTKEIVSWDIVRPQRLAWQHKLERRIGNMTWSESSRQLLIWNLFDGIDIYDVTNRPIWSGKLKFMIQRNFVVQMAFTTSDCFVITGSDTGAVYLWDL